MKNKKIPKYPILRIYISAIILHLMLVLPVFAIIWMKNDPSIWTKKSHVSQQLNETEKSKLIGAKTEGPQINIELGGSRTDGGNTAGGKNLTKINNLETNLLLAVVIIIFIVNFPFRLYFNRKRKNKLIPPQLYKYCRRFLLKMPLINSAIFFSAFLILHVFMFIVLQQKNSFSDDISRNLYTYYLYISLFSSILIVAFAYLWQKHLTHFKYLEHIYNPDELRVKIFKSKIGGIRNRLWISSALTTLLPLFVVVFYLVISITSYKELGQLTPDQNKIIYGHYYQDLVDQDNLFKTFFYTNAVDNLFLIMGVSMGIIVSLIYLSIYLRWTTNDIVAPVKELLYNMKRIGEGHLDAQAIVRTNDEIGELTAGYNQMSSELNNYISRISRMNEAYYRFVPREFLEELGKKDISQVELGDQVQREMTILFTDIRDFTELSEDLSPKDTFDFINQYLGIMEPIITNNNGFIDKYIGDSIMALFSKDTDDALIATLEMRRVLVDFNEIRESEGKSPIEFGTGIHTGNLMLGIVGGYGRMDGTVVSDAVNLASRLEGITKYYGAAAIISEDTLIKLKNPTMFNYRLLDIAKVKGKKKAVYIFELIDAENEPARSKKIETKPYFVKAVEYYKQQQFEDALSLFQKVEKIHPTDKAALLYIKRCQNIIQNGTPEDWNNIEIFKFK